jgi:lipoic acid synthetase
MLEVRWLGRVPYREALSLQRGLMAHGVGDHLLLLEHPHVFTHGPGADLATNLRCDPAAVGAEIVAADRGGDVTYHGPGQLVGYPILSLPPKHGADGPADVRAHVRAVENLVVAVLARLGLHEAGRLEGYPGVWVEPRGPRPRKVCAIGVRVGRGSSPRRTMHGFALNVAPDLAYMRDHIVPCGIAGLPVTSLAEEGVHATMREVVDLVATLAAERWGAGGSRRSDVAWSGGVREPEHPARGRRVEVALGRKPAWLRPRLELSEAVLATRRTVRDLRLVTVCEEAACPNLSECWRDGTATFMVLGERCTRACGFCAVDTRVPLAPDPDEPRRVAEAVARMGLAHAVVTMVARDDLADGGMGHVAACVRAIRDVTVGTRVETLVSDARGGEGLGVLLAERPDVFNHNVETVARLQREVRPSAGYARSLAVLARAREAGLVTKSGFMLGLGETRTEVEALLADLASVGVSIVTIGQYLRPSAAHLPVRAWATPGDFALWARVGESLGIPHVEASPLTRSSYHARAAHDAATVTS